MTFDGKHSRIRIPLFLLCFVCYGYFFQSAEHNEAARFAHIKALAEYGTNQIDPWCHMSADIVRIDGHCYPNKAPGATYAAIVPWLVFSKAGALAGLTGQDRDVFAAFMTSWWTVGLCTALIVLLLYNLLFEITQHRLTASAIALAYGLGTNAFPFATDFFSHQVTAACLFVSFRLLFTSTTDGTKRKSGTMFIAGMAAGFAIASDYIAAIGAGLLFIYAVFRCRGATSIIFFAVGGILGVIPTLLYHAAVTGHPLMTPYSITDQQSNAYAFLQSRGFFGAELPTAEGLFGVFFSSTRGQFYLNPWLAAVFPLLFCIKRRRELLPETIFCLALVLCFFLFNASLSYWQGGLSTGPRYSLPAVPFLALLIGSLIKPTGLKFLAPFAVISTGAMVAITSTEPRVRFEVSDAVRSGVADYSRARFAAVDTTPFDFSLSTGQFGAFNIGGIAGLPRPYELVPLLLLLGIAVPAILTRAAAADTTPGTSPLRLKRFLAFVVTGPLIGFGLVPTVLWSTAESALNHEHGIALSGDSAALHEVKPRAAYFAFDRPGSNLTRLEVWDGLILAPESGVYVFYLSATGGASLSIDGRSQLKVKPNPWLTPSEAALYLERGLHPITVKFRRGPGTSSLRVHWQPPEAWKRLIPADVLFLAKSKRADSPPK